MSDFPFSIPRGGDADVVNGVSYSGSTLSLSRATGEDLTTTIATGDVVTGVTYSGTTLSLQRATGADLTTTIDTGGGGGSQVLFLGEFNTSSARGTEVVTVDTVLLNTGSESGYGWNNTTGEFKVSSATVGQYKFGIIVSATTSTSNTNISFTFYKNDTTQSNRVVEVFEHGKLPSNGDYTVLHYEVIADLDTADDLVFLKSFSDFTRRGNLPGQLYIYKIN